ncbi:MAG TPA: rhomboid family intramembrane serine protease [Candidatus Polarisedimenticolia bacterium]|nr:rhomboid family intramembrane serine protease [Candidatus Polarisedimenticolia bacterium]
MIPFKDDNPTRLVPYITIALLLLNLAVFVRLLLLPPEAQQTWVLRLAIIPYDLTHLPLGRPDRWPLHLLPLLTAMFVHAGWLHLIGNLLYLWIFGNNVEDVMGHGRFVVFYGLCGLLAASVQVAARPESRVPMIGASGAIAGVLGAYLVLFPTARVRTLLFLIVIVRVVALPALIVLGVWLLLQLIAAGRGDGQGVAWFAHLGGFLAGALLIVPFRRKRPRQALY